MVMTTYQRALEALCNDLALPKGDEYTQDWAHELPETYRTAEWFDAYLSAIDEHRYGPEGQRILLSLVLDVANDLAGDGELSTSQWKRVERELLRVPGEHAELVDYWAVPGEPLEDCFAITPLIRRLVAESPNGATTGQREV